MTRRPSLHPHYRGLFATTLRSVPVPRISTQILVGLPLAPLLLHRCDRSPRPPHKPMPSSRRLHAGRHLDSKQVSSRLVPGQRLPPGFDDIPTLSTSSRRFICQCRPESSVASGG